MADRMRLIPKRASVRITHSPFPWRIAMSQGGKLHLYADGETHPIKPKVIVTKRPTRQELANLAVLGAASELLTCLKEAITVIEPVLAPNSSIEHWRGAVRRAEEWEVLKEMR